MAHHPKAVPLVAPGHTRPVTHLSFSSLQDDGTYVLISSCKDGNPMLREWTGDWIGTFFGHKGAVWSSKLSPDTSRAASGSADFTAKIWDTYSGEPLHSFPHNHIVRSVAISPSTSHLLTGGQEKKVRMFDLGRPDAEPDIFSDNGSNISHDGTVKSVVWVGDHTGVTAGEDGLLKWWDLRTRKLTTSLSFPGPITSMELSPQTNRLVVTSGKTVSFIPALLNGGQTHSLTLPYAPSSASIHPILQDRFVTGSLGDEWVRIHDVTGEEREVLKGHHGPVHCVEFSPDGEMFASGSEDGTIRLWQTTPGKSYGLWQGTQANGGP
ncbi:serine/threonine kinase receptor associated protein [Laetiporus sulphureus 93-53]|uniref:Serine-threonine kinase receptor-associated protein n=1 Tax=Laetiporus sulphureus 93-53 TaxID=1314785 RepID=A0A165HBI0_9APHY|nr:serine/threonine kinase receptor associated protein [Laetiporus sulphureus 93-53]KZT11506.1 serine/threonine kinase receptor associated protein [Laetiporus sulphureus 93-53]